MQGNLLIAQAGGPSCALNATLLGVIQEAKKHGEIDKILGAVSGAGGILEEDFIDLGKQSKKFFELLPNTPASVIGTSRRMLKEEDFSKLVSILKKNNVRYLLYNGGNGSMATCLKLNEMAKGQISVIGVPKTIDNDIEITDHCPGYGSAARYMAVTTREISKDIESMPIHVSIIEAMGRNTGWIAAASALGRNTGIEVPLLIYVPERVFRKDKFLEDVEKHSKKYGGVVVVVSEGILDEERKPLVPPLLVPGGKDPYYGDVGACLSGLVWKELGIKSRCEKPGIALRASATLQSNMDVEEAIETGRMAVKQAILGQSGIMIGMNRISNSPYDVEYTTIPLTKVASIEKKLPDQYINREGNGVTEEFIEYCRPLIGKLPEYAKLERNVVERK